jgi:hypothetical protein
MKNQAFKVMVKPTNENQVTKLQCQLAINNLLVVCLFEFMKLVELAIV